MTMDLRAARHLIAPLVALALLVVAPLASAHGKKDRDGANPAAAAFSLLRGGATTLTLDPQAAAALADLKVEVTAVGGARANDDGTISFPIPRGALDLSGPAGQIEHRGGLELSTDTASLRLTRFDVNVDASPDLTAIVDHNRLDRPEVFDLTITGTPSVSKGALTIPGVELRLTDAAAAHLNDVFGTSAFTGGLLLGTAETSTRIVRERALPAKLRLRRGATTVALDPELAKKLDGAGVAVAPVGAARPAVLGRIAFPIRSRGSKLASDTLAGRIRHGGGLGLATTDTTVELRRFTIRPADGVLGGKLGRRGPRAELFSLDLSAAETIVTPTAFRASGVGLALTAGAASALNDAFGLPGAFAEGEVVGTATVDSAVRSRYRHGGRHHKRHR